MSTFFRIRIPNRHRTGGFTLVELILTITVLGILVGISIPNFTAAKSKALYTVIEEYIHFIEQGEEFYLAENGTFFPENGRIEVLSGVHRDIPELGVTLPDGHLHRYVIYALNEEKDGIGYNNLYIIVYTDVDMDGDGENDVLISTTSYRTSPPTEQPELQEQPDPKEKKPKKVGNKKPKKPKK